MSKEQNTTGNITPPNKDLETLKNNFPNCFEKNGEFNFEKFKKQLSKNEINFSKESYGMDWLGKSYARLLATDETTTLLKADEKFNQKDENKNSENLLIKGDNLEVLKHLSNAYYEKIKMIYIDPPYNTGSDGFVYADDRKFTVEELQELSGVSEERAKRILDFTQSKSNSHSAWLTFMYPRLYIAEQLLKEDGVIFVSIDDNEVAQLKILLDDVFGEDNFQGHIHWRRRHNQPNDKTKMIGLVAEHILVYSKNKEAYKQSGVGKLELTGSFSNPDSDPKGDWASKPWKTGSDQGGSIYQITTPTGKILDEEWMGEEKTFKEHLEDGRIYFPDKGNGAPRKKYYRFERENEGQSATNWWNHDKFGHNQEANNHMTSLFGGVKNIFSNPKPIKLIRNLIYLANLNNRDTVLDFFAGSGTTGDAIMLLNAEDNGNRKFILAQLPELIDPKNNKPAYEFVKNELKIETPTIFEITKERLIRASKKIQEENIDKPTKSKKIKCEGCGEDGEHCHSCKGEHTLKTEASKKKDLSNQDLGFKVFETMPIWEDYNFESEELDAKQMQLFDESKLTKEDIKALLVTWKTYDGILLTETLQERDLNGYTAHYSNEKLYLTDKGFKTKNLKQLLEKIDSDKDFNPNTIIAFGYHFESKNLREISENIKSYANKKSIDIDFITRY
jgi:adenine-specific DNA-methyltransferase